MGALTVRGSRVFLTGPWVVGRVSWTMPGGGGYVDLELGGVPELDHALGEE